MIKEATNWLFNNINFIVVPSINDNLSGDIGMRSILKYDRNIINSPNIIVGYSSNEYYHYSDKNSNYYIFLLNGRVANPIYSSIRINSNSLEFINFDLSNYNIGDKVIILNSDTLEVVLQTTILNKLNNVLSFIDDINITLNRYKVVNNQGVIYSINNIISAKNLINHKYKHGTIIYANT